MDVDEDDEAAWEGWDVESDSSEDSSDDEGWLDVPSDGDDLELSDSDDEKPKPESKDAGPDEKIAGATPENDEPARISTLATTKVSR